MLVISIKISAKLERVLSHRGLVIVMGLNFCHGVSHAVVRRWIYVRDTSYQNIALCINMNVSPVYCASVPFVMWGVGEI